MNSTVAAATKPSNTNNKIKHSTGENVGTFVIYLIVALFALICVLPFVLVIIVSFSSEKSITINGYSFWPSEWSAAAYKMLFLPSSSVPQSYLVTTIATVVGTVVHHIRRRLHPCKPFLPLQRRSVPLLLHHHGFLCGPCSVVHDV